MASSFDIGSRVVLLPLPVGMYNVRAAVKGSGDFAAAIRRDDALRFEILRPPESESSSLIELPQSWRVVHQSEVPQP